MTVSPVEPKVGDMVTIAIPISILVLVALDIKRAGISWWNMLLPILLVPVGGIIYVWITKNDRRGSDGSRPSPPPRPPHMLLTI